ncbi:MerR family transcriptional regulator [Paenibacillus sp. PR3]|uniref:MerR family transcriptional regulator n=1 Tax=Paenibacillus terricola TaxID=2763503 RepID=A0ABR8N1M7_9BACL|nr:MerR family transcriptional regulator [Paenibacillus terricola]MBD3920374.1 MerR family transcriptional regulator [Paenibacillus terricola]
MMEERTFSIKQTATQTGITEDTIRYYEKIALLPRAERKDNGHRIYRQEDIDTIQLISCLKKTGMPLDEMRPFLSVSTDADPAEYPELVGLLKSHRENIVSQIASLQQVVDFIDMKLEKGKYRRDCSDETRDDASDHKVSTVQMNYFPLSTGKSGV